MRLGMVGLGRMGANMARRLMRGGHEVVVTDLSPEAVKGMATDGAIPSSSLEDFCSKLGSPRIAWLMVPAGGPTESTAQAIAQQMKPGDILIDGGNSYFKDDIRRSKLFGPSELSNGRAEQQFHSNKTQLYDSREYCAVFHRVAGASRDILLSEIFPQRANSHAS